MIKKILILLFLLNLNNCGYTPIYKFNENINFKIKTMNFEGDRVVNNYLKSKLTRYIYVDKGEEFIINVKTNYTKEALDKDITGEVSTYQLRLSISINTVNLNSENLKEFKEINKLYNFSEEFLLKNDDNKFQESSYENSIKQNMVNNIFDRFTLSLMNR
jgi:hypothetical protein